MGILDSLTDGAWGNYFGNMADTGNPGRALESQELQMRQFQQQLFMQQLEQQKKKYGGDVNRALYGLSPGGQKEQYGVNFGPPVTAGPASAPIVYGQGEGPHIFDIGGAAGQPGTAQPQPSQQPAGPMDNLAATGTRLKAAETLATTKAGLQAQAQQQYPGALSDAQSTVARLEALRDDPDLGLIVGGPLGLKGRTGPLGQKQADLVNEANELQSRVLGSTFTNIRTVNGRPINPGILKDFSAGLNTNRVGSVEAYKGSINNLIKQLKDETAAAFKATGLPGDGPTWAPQSSVASKPANVSVPPQAAAYLKANPHLRAQFDAKYGNGAALSVLGQ